MSDLIFVNHFLFLHFLDSNHFVGLPIPTNSHLSKSSAPDDLARYEIFDRDLCALKTVIFGLFMKYLLLDQLLLLIRKPHLVHLVL